MLVRSSTGTEITRTTTTTPTPLYVFRDANGNTWQFPDEEGHRRGLTRVSDEPLPKPGPRPAAAYNVEGITAARQVGDASNA